MAPQSFFDNVSKFVVHYGHNHLSKLSDFDLIVLESKAHAPEDIKAIKKDTNYVLAYLNVFEIDQEQAEYKDFIDHVLKGTNSSERVFIDLRSKLWIDFLYSKVKKMINEDGYDGIFIDTLSYIEDCIDSDSIMFSQILALCDFMKRIKTDFHDIRIIQNNGFAIVLNYTKTYLDGICWENPENSSSEMRRINKKIIKKINASMEENQLIVLLLTEETKKKSYFKMIADKNNYLYYDAPKNYLGVVR